LPPPSARAAAKGHTFISCTAPYPEALPTNRTPFHVRGTRSFSNLMSTRDAGCRPSSEAKELLTAMAPTWSAAKPGNRGSECLLGDLDRPLFATLGFC
jgi:hypothetical protein